MKKEALSIKFGGSNAVDAWGINYDYFKLFFDEVGIDVFNQFAKLAFIIGGGKRVREQQALVETNEKKDAIGIKILREHATQLRDVLNEQGLKTAKEIPHNENEAIELFRHNRVVSMGGLKIGQSTDAVAVTAGEIFESQGFEALIIILSNIAYIYTSDPETNRNTTLIEQASINHLVDSGVLNDNPKKFIPGMHAALDPVAVYRLKQKPKKLYFTHSNEIKNIRAFLLGEKTTKGTHVT